MTSSQFAHCLDFSFWQYILILFVVRYIISLYASDILNPHPEYLFVGLHFHTPGNILFCPLPNTHFQFPLFFQELNSLTPLSSNSASMVERNWFAPEYEHSLSSFYRNSQRQTISSVLNGNKCY